MENFILIVLCISAGYFLRYFKIAPEGAHKGLNIWLLYIALPAVSLKYIPKIHVSWEILFPMASTILVWAGSYAFVTLYARYKKYRPRTSSTLELACGYSNTSFLGFPLITAFFGEKYLSIAVLCDQVLFVLLSTAGIITATRGSGSKQNITLKFVFKKLFTFPPFIGCLAAVVLPQLLDLAPAEPLLDKITPTVAPIALFSVGLQLSFKGWVKQRGQLSMALLYKLILAPALVMLIALLFGVMGYTARISVFEASMPTFLTASVLAEQFRLNTKLINLIIGIGIVAGIVISFAWSKILMLVF